MTSLTWIVLIGAIFVLVLIVLAMSRIFGGFAEWFGKGK